MISFTKLSKVLRPKTGGRTYDEFSLIIYWGTKVWNIDINFIVIKKQIKK